VLGIVFAVLTGVAGIKTGIDALGTQIFYSHSYSYDGTAIIGGADGPTEIFVSSNPSPMLLILLVICAAVCVVCFVLYARLSRKKRR
jgi:Na+-transporting methylmalonyl-CoA/oxaloacetate decarboxylase beta subunit